LVRAAGLGLRAGDRSGSTQSDSFSGFLSG
jgi:hypothetical protein